MRGAEDKHRRVKLTTDKAMCEKKATKAMKPSARSLFQPINSLFEATHMMRIMRMKKSRRPAHRNSLSEKAMKKSILNIELMNRPIVCDSNRENKTDSSRENNRGKSVMKSIPSCW